MNVQALTQTTCSARSAAAACVLASVLFASGASGNLVVNGSFEDGLNGWTLTAAADGSDFGLSGPGHTGLASMGFSADSGLEDVIEQDLATQAGALYQIELWVMNLGVGNDLLSIGFGSETVVFSPVNTPLEDWALITFQAVADDASSTLRIGAFDANSALLVDDISVTLVPAPGVLGALALAGLRGSRRRGGRACG